jgi:formylglycine-generating enzyme required for sulfatase activity
MSTDQNNHQSLAETLRRIQDRLDQLDPAGMPGPTTGTDPDTAAAIDLNQEPVTLPGMAREPGAAATLDLIDLYLLLRQGIQYADTQIAYAPAKRRLLDEKRTLRRTAVPRVLLERTREELAHGLVTIPCTGSADPAALPLLMPTLAGAALWALIISRLTHYGWYHELCAIASEDLANLTAEIYHPYLQRKVRHRGPLPTGQCADLRVALERRLSDPAYLEGIRNLLDDLSDPQQGQPWLVAAFRAHHTRLQHTTPTTTILRAVLLFVSGAIASGIIGNRADALLGQVWNRFMQPADVAAEPAVSRSQPVRHDTRKRMLVETAAGLMAVPVTLAHWNEERHYLRKQFGGTDEQPAPYWCYVPGGRYRIGGWQAGEPEAWVTLRAFWIARFPITRRQYQAFMEAGGYTTRDYWTPNGWQWRQEYKRTQPRYWDDFRFQQEWQPVVGIAWFEAAAFCAWLDSGAAAAGYRVRLPTEAEWEVAAAYDAAGNRRPYPWGDQPLTPKRAIYDRSSEQGPALIGSCPAGAAACGALDMVGQVWEVTGSRWQDYPARSALPQKDFTVGEGDVPWRGGSWWSSSTNVRCAARGRFDPNLRYGGNYGVRVLFSPCVRT